MGYKTVNKKQQVKVQKVTELLEEFKEKEPELRGQILIIFPAGVPIASTWESKFDPILVGALTSAVKMTFQHLCNHLKRGNLDRVFVNSDDGKSIIQNAGPNAILITILDYTADVYRLAFVATNMALKIEQIMEGFVE